MTPPKKVRESPQWALYETNLERYKNPEPGTVIGFRCLQCSKSRSVQTSLHSSNPEANAKLGLKRNCRGSCNIHPVYST